MKNPLLTSSLLISVALLMAACSDSDEMASPIASDMSGSEPYLQFWGALSQLCGNAFAGERVVARPEDDLLTGDEALIVHFHECSATEIKAALHIEQSDQDSWDRSRTWVYTLHEGMLELDHDHRNPDGSHAKETGYGGYTVEPGSADRQLFIYTQRTGDNGEVLGWRIEVVPGDRYTYGTMADGDWTWRLDFDLTAPVEPPPAPWGHN